MENEGWHEGSLLGLSGYYWQSCTLHAGVKLAVFTLIGDDSLSVETIAERLKGDRRGTETLLHALTAMKLLQKERDRFANTPASRSLLCKDSDGYIGHMILHHHHLAASWVRLDEAVREGKPVRKRASYSEGEWRESFLMGMFNTAMRTAPAMAEAIDLSGCHRLLDLGGGPGTYAVHFCLRNPDLKATVYDLPTTRPFAEKIIGRFGLSDRIEFVPGDYMKEDIPGGYDATWLSHILHAHGPQACREILGKAVSVLGPGGKILVHDFILDDTMDGPLFPALFSLNMLLGTPKGRAYSQEQIGEMLSGAGIRQIERMPFHGPTDSGLMMGVV